jgi:hypothetical protein
LFLLIYYGFQLICSALEKPRYPMQDIEQAFAAAVANARGEAKIAATA